MFIYFLPFLLLLLTSIDVYSVVVATAPQVQVQTLNKSQTTSTQISHQELSHLLRNLRVHQILSISTTIWALSSPPHPSTSTSFGKAVGLCLINSSLRIFLTPSPRPPPSPQSPLFLTGGKLFHCTQIKLAIMSLVPSSSPVNTPISPTPRRHLTRLSIQQVITIAVKSALFPVDHKNGIYLILTSQDVTMQDFCRVVCGFHYFTFLSMVGYTLPYAWVGNSGKQCLEVYAYLFTVPTYIGGGGLGALKLSNGDMGVDGMISVIGHELVELSLNLLVNSWYAGEDPTAPTEIGDLCERLYGTGERGGYIGQVMKDQQGRTFNMNGRSGRKFSVQWIWVLHAMSYKYMLPL